MSLAELLEIRDPEYQPDPSVYRVQADFVCTRQQLIAKKILFPGCDHTKINTIEADRGVWVRRGDEYFWHWRLNTHELHDLRYRMMSLQ